MNTSVMNNYSDSKNDITLDIAERRITVRTFSYLENLSL